jgi:DNA polymerase-3 subunit delta
MEGNSFLFLGPELGEKLDALNAIRARLGPGAEVTTFYAGETPIPQIVSVLKNGSLFCDERLFIIKNAESISVKDTKKKDEAEMLSACLENPGKGVTIILISDETKLTKRLEDAVPKANRRVFWELFENKKNEWVTAFFRREGGRVDQGGVEAILELVENNTDALRRECVRLMLFLGKDRIIGAADVEQCLSHTREESAFTLFAAVARGNLAAGLDIARALLGAKQSVQAVLAGLAWCFRKLGDYLALKESGNVNDFEMKKIGLSSPKARADYTEAARRWAGAGAALALIGEYDYLFRSFGAAFEEILMDELVYKLARGQTRRMSA